MVRGLATRDGAAECAGVEAFDDIPLSLECALSRSRRARHHRPAAATLAVVDLRSAIQRNGRPSFRPSHFSEPTREFCRRQAGVVDCGVDDPAR